jgi:hypothetical protein
MGLSAPPRAGRRPARRRPDEAESVYWLDLRKHKNNGWALSRLLQALRAQKKDAMAAAVEARLKTARARASVKRETAVFAPGLAL